MAKPKAEERWQDKDRPAVKTQRDLVQERRLRMAGEDMTPEIAKANPGVPQVGTGTVVFRGLSGGMNNMTPQFSPIQIPGIPTLPTAPTQPKNGTLNSPFQGTGAVMPHVNSASPTYTDPRLAAGRGQNYASASQGYTGTAGYGGVYKPNVQSGGQLSPDKNPVFQQPRPAINPFGTAGMYSFNQNFPNFQLPSANQPQAQIVASDGTVNPPVPTGTFTPGGGNEQEWRNWWNWQAQHPTESRALLTQMAAAQGQPDPFAVHIPTIDEIQKMKWEQRRRGWEEGGSSGQSYGSGFTPSYNPLASERDLIGGSFGNNAISASWRIGG